MNKKTAIFVIPLLVAVVLIVSVFVYKNMKTISKAAEWLKIPGTYKRDDAERSIQLPSEWSAGKIGVTGAPGTNVNPWATPTPIPGLPQLQSQLDTIAGDDAGKAEFEGILKDASSL